MPNATWLADVARSVGYPVILVPGWEQRGHGTYAASFPKVVVGHHTGTSQNAPGDYPSLRVVRDGREDLPGPLCNLGLGRSGTIYVVAAGVAWHAGSSRHLNYIDLNNKSIGIEAESAGGGIWTREQLDCYPKLVGALLKHMNVGVDHYISHRGCALPAGRKPDPKGIEDSWMRDRAKAWMTGQGDDMAQVPQNEWVEVRDLMRRLGGMLLIRRKPWYGGTSDISVHNQAEMDKAEEYDALQYLYRNNVTETQTNIQIAELARQMAELNKRMSALTQTVSEGLSGK